MNKPERIAHLSELLRKASDARALAASPIWAESWDALERELLDRLLECEATEDEKRYRLQVAIEVARRLRRMISTRGMTDTQLETELAVLEGAKMRPIA